LTEGQKIAIRNMRATNRRLTYREIGAFFGVSPAAVCITVSEGHADRQKPVPAPEPAKPARKEYSSFIRPIPDHLKMAGNGRICRLSRI
jgi:hypothetical protein